MSPSASTDDFFDEVDIVEGAYPAPANPSPDSVVEVMIANNFASEFGIQVGDTFYGYNWRLEADDALQITEVRVAGIWQARDETSTYWFYQPRAFEDSLMIHEDTFRERISPYTEEEVNLGLWYIITDGSGISTNRVDDLIEREIDVEMTIDQLLSGAYISSSPGEELRPYQRTVTTLSLTLTVFSTPVIALMVVFLTMIVGLIVDKQQNETAVLRSRGTSPFQVLSLATVEALIIGSISILLGMGLAIVFTRLIGSTSSFLQLSYDADFIVSIPSSTATTAIVALAFTVLIRLIPAISASQHTIVSYKLSTSRVLIRPLLQRLGVDLLLIPLIAYFYYQIVQQGSMISIEGGIANIEDAYNQPFVFLLPPLTIFAFTLLLLRILPLLLRFITWLIYLSNNVGLLIVTRQLERSPRSYFLPLLLLITTISLGIYTASFARTIDRYLYEQQFYRVGADATIRLIPVSIGTGGLGGGDDNVSSAYVPISAFHEMEGIDEATRIGEYPAAQGPNIRLG